MMSLVWKLLRQHISIAQLAGFFFANLFGMFIVLLGLQFYNDVKPLFSQEDGFLKPEYLIVSKRISGMSVLSAGDKFGFNDEDVQDITSQPFCKSVGAFTASQYRVVCSMGVNGIARFGTDMFFESVPDRFVDTDLSNWKFNPEEGVIPIVLPRTYLAIYNFGFAQSQSLPKISEGVVGMIDMVVLLRGNGQEQRLKGKVIGFSTRLNTILVPESFIKWSNAKFAPEADLTPNRLIVEVKNPADDAIVKYINKHNLELEDDKLDAGKATYFLRVVTILVMCIGMLISILSFYILMLSIYLLVQKNTEKLRNLLLIGYSPVRVSLPYQILTVGMNGLVLVLSFILLYVVRGYYMDRLWVMFPQMQDGSLMPALCLGCGLFFVVSIINIVAIHNKVMRIWNRKD
jgi:hypothetical protein